MDFYVRFRKLPEKKQQAFIQAFSKIGDPNEIISYIAAMPVFCEEGTGFLPYTSEVRIDDRFMVVCRGKEIAIYKANFLKQFHVSYAEWFKHYDFCVNNNIKFHVEKKYARKLYDRLVSLCPEFFHTPVDGTPLVTREFVIDSRGVSIMQYSLFGKPKSAELIPLSSILACFQTNDFDAEDCGNDYLHLQLRDGSVRTISTNGAGGGYQTALKLKAFLPELTYSFPDPR